MARLRNIWAVAAVTAGSLGITLSLVLSGALGTAVATGASPSAVAHDTNGAAALFGCRASVARVELAGKVLAEPAIANNATSPCADDQTLVQQTGLLGGTSPLNLGSVGPAGAYTYETGADGGTTSATYPAATSVANVQALSLSLGGYTLSAAGPLIAQAAIECGGPNGTTVETQGSSDLDLLTVTAPNGTVTPVEIGGGLNQLLGSLPAALSALVSITANEQTVTTTSLTERLLDIKVLGSGIQIVVGEAGVSYAGGANACDGNIPPGTVSTITTPPVTNTVTGANGTATTVTSPAVTNTVTGTSGTVTVTSGTSTTVVEPSGSVPGYLQQCATGSVLDPTSGNCVIFENGQTIFVSKPFKGPVGGTVLSLGDAKAKYKSPCLSGAGPGYVFVVSASHENAYGTPQSDRILILGSNDHTAGLAGDDCMDGQGTTQKITDGNGEDRDYVAKGTNRIIVGNGNDHVYGGNGKDWITAGTGSDTIYGGKLATRIDAYGNYKDIFGGPANDRIWTNSIRAFIHCGKGNANILFGRKKIAAYGKLHGCQKIGILK